MKFIILLALLGIVAALASAGLFMLRKGRPDAGAADSDGRDRRMARALAWRVGLSVGLFLLILLAYAAGWIEPSGLPAGR